MVTQFPRHNAILNASSQQSVPSGIQDETTRQTTSRGSHQNTQTAAPQVSPVQAQGRINTTSDAAQNARSFWANAPRVIYAHLNAGIQNVLAFSENFDTQPPALKSHKATFREALQTEGLIHPATREQVEDLKTILLKNPEPGLMLSVKQKDPYQTEFFLNLEDEDVNIPEHINQKFTENEIKQIYFIVPNEALPLGGVQEKKDAIKRWLSLPPNVHFELFKEKSKK